MKFIFLVFFLISPFAQAMEGIYEVTSGSLRILRSDGFKTHFYPGKYKGSLSFEEKKAFLQLERKDIRTDATLLFPAGAGVPENGEIFLDGYRTGQTFRIAGNIRTERSQSPLERGNEGCTFYRREWVCRGWGPDRYCRWEEVPRQGYRVVEFYYLTKTITLALDLESNNEGKAKFNGRETSKRKIYTYEGDCF